MDSAFMPPTLVRDTRTAAAGLALGLAAIAVSAGIVQQPWLLSGLVFGAIVLAIAISAPLALVAMMLVLGPFDLSFMTGGFKALFPELGGLDMNGIRLIGATAGFTAFIMNAPAARWAMISKYGRVYLVFLVVTFASLFHSFDPLEGLRLHLKLAYPFMTFLVIVGLADTEEKLEMLTRYTLLSAALIVCIINPLFTLDGGARIDPDGFRRVRGLGAHENPFSFYLMLMLFIAYARLIIRKQLRYLVLCGALALWIGLTLTRITFLAAIVGVLAITLISAAARRQYRAVAAGALMTIVLALPVLPLILERSLGFIPTPGELMTLVQHPAAMYEAINWQGRNHLWPIVWTGFMAAPIFGLGLGSSAVVIREHFPSEAASVAHNEYLRLAADTGVIGLLLFMTATGVWLMAAVRASMQNNEKLAEYGLPAAAGLVGWAIVALTDNPFDYYTPFTQYIGFLMGGVVAMKTMAAQREDVDRRLS